MFAEELKSAREYSDAINRLLQVRDLTQPDVAFSSDRSFEIPTTSGGSSAYSNHSSHRIHLLDSAQHA